MDYIDGIMEKLTVSSAIK